MSVTHWTEKYANKTNMSLVGLPRQLIYIHKPFAVFLDHDVPKNFLGSLDDPDCDETLWGMFRLSDSVVSFWRLMSDNNFLLASKMSGLSFFFMCDPDYESFVCVLQISGHWVWFSTCWCVDAHRSKRPMTARPSSWSWTVATPYLTTSLRNAKSTYITFPIILFTFV